MNYTDEDLDQMSWEDLLALRKQVEGDQQQQNKVANYEHQAYAREEVERDPMQALVMQAAIPGYQLKKQVQRGLNAVAPEVFPQGSRSQGGFAQMASGYKGVLQGLLARMQR